MRDGPGRDPGAAGLGALLIGLLAAPWVYAAFGALSRFPTPFALVATPLLALATLDLGLEAFARLRGFTLVRSIGAILSSAVLLTILSVLTEFTLLTATERTGLFATVWLGSAVVWLAISLPTREMGPEALLRPRLNSPARRRAALAVVAVTYPMLAVLCWRHLTTPPVFIG